QEGARSSRRNRRADRVKTGGLRSRSASDQHRYDRFSVPTTFAACARDSTPIAGRRNRKREPFGDQAPSSATLATGVEGESLFHVLQQFKAASAPRGASAGQHRQRP